MRRRGVRIEGPSGRGGGGELDGGPVLGVDDTSSARAKTWCRGVHGGLGVAPPKMPPVERLARRVRERHDLGVGDPWRRVHPCSARSPLIRSDVSHIAGPCAASTTSAIAANDGRWWARVAPGTLALLPRVDAPRHAAAGGLT
jgi:hypothetical protein